ncbi:Not1 domain-containing [Chlorella sorokiniana]|uniref:Not1 domain-containing n=1 Tax=Chlorella sorokiniana TaxID=3076 RepID=A0A2P6TJ64_CHLSO|nr:Not1 domain-containing [Chlorella sorokiniana]|eukprot:PRW39295.1 Not1 domain-containing [Chlorella sorokiniana]
MSKQRKLQIEIDQTLRKIADGVEEWDVLFEKFEETEASADGGQRDKIAQEMKKELKKLQRLREQERFKGLEKELKIKQFSSEGLKRDSTDPVMMRKVQCADWLSDTVSQLETQVEQFEADLEALGPSASGKSGKNKPHRVVELEGFMHKHGEHVKKLEQVLRLLENDQVTPEEVEEALRDPLEYYLQSSTEADYIPDETIYDSLPLLKEVDDSIGKIASHTPRAGAKGKQEGEGEGEGAAEGGKPKRGKAAKERKAKAAAAEAANAKAAAQASAAVTPPPGLPPPPAPPSPAAAGTPNSTGTRSQSFKAVATAGIRPPAAAAASGAAASGSPTKQSPGGPETPAPGAQPARVDDQSPHSVQSSSGEAAEARRLADVAAAAQAAEIAAAAAAAAAASGTPRGRDTGGRIPTVLSFNHLQSQAEAVLGLAATADGVMGTEPSTPMGGDGGMAPESHLPWIPTLADLHMLDASVASRPQPGDGDWKLPDGSISSPGGQPPAQHPVHVPASFPNMVHPSLQRESTFRKLSAETNFFAFYFQQNTRQQLLAANALKAQGWRFHTQINAWFARQSQPRVVTTEHEQGPLVYFDALLHDVTPSSPTGLAAQPMYSGWCPRVSRSDFTFEYKYMEMEDTSVPSDV